MRTREAGRAKAAGRALAVIGVLALTGACAGPGSYVWVNDLPPEPAAAARDYVINAGDLVSIRVFTHEDMTSRARVRSDGKMAFPILGDIEVQGKRPAVLAKELEVRLKDYIVQPNVTVVVEESQPIQVSVVGEVQHAGVFNLDPSATVMTALANAGGPNEYADRDRVFVVRRKPAMRVRFTYEALSRGEGAAPTFLLRAGDVVVVE